MMAMGWPPAPSVKLTLRNADTAYDTLSSKTQPVSNMQDRTSSTALDGIDEQTVADTALVVEALAAFAGPPDDLETHHERRAWELISTLADDLSMTPSELLRINIHQPRTP
jgi:hypothetical protein